MSHPLIKRPAFQFYPSDWRNDLSLRTCSIAARGLWLELMVTMHQGSPYGHLALDGRQLADEEVARMVGLRTKEYRKLMEELEAHRVFSRTDAGIVYSRRMVRDEAVRNLRAAGGEKGASYGIKGRESGRLGGRPPKTARREITPLITPLHDETKRPSYPPPSSSSSTALPLLAAAAASVPATAAAAEQAIASAERPGWQQRRAQLLDRFVHPAHRDAAEGFLRSAQHPEAVAGHLLAAMDPNQGGHAPEIVGQALDEMLVNSVSKFHSATFNGYLRRLKQPAGVGATAGTGDSEDLKEKILNDIKIGRYA